MSKKKTTEEFIEDAIEVHGNKYDYSKVVYTRAKENVIINCPTHGDFPQCASGHLTGRGCRDCSNQRQSDSKSKTTEEFIIGAKKVHGEKNSYDKTNYSGAKKIVIITCKKHGDFPQIAENHLSGRIGCEQCAKESVTKTTEEFIIAAKKVHRSLFTYNNVFYTGVGIKVLITCKKHGDFPQTPDNHLRGQGCPKCKLESDSKRIYTDKPTYLYYIKIDDRQYKIGICRKYKNNKNIEDSMKRRFRKEINLGVKIEILKSELFDDGYQAFIKEQTIKNGFYNYRINKDDQILNSGYTETFTKDVLKETE